MQLDACTILVTPKKSKCLIMHTFVQIMKYAQCFGAILWTLEVYLNREKDSERKRIMVVVNSRSSCRPFSKHSKC
jgi:hypothetical protein